MSNDTDTVTISRDLPCKLTPAELADLRAKAVEIVEAIDELTDRKKEAAADLNDSIKSNRKELKRICRELKQGEVTRAVECHELKEYRTNTIRIVRKDTGELVSEVAMSADDLQTTIPGSNGTVATTGTKKKMTPKGKKNGAAPDEPAGDGEETAGAGLQ